METKWNAENLGPRQAKAFNAAVSKFQWDAKTVKEVTDYGEHLVTPMFTGPVNPNAAPMLDAIHAKYAGIVSGDNVRSVVADIEAATVKLAETRIVEDKRTTADERAERTRIMAEADAARAKESARVAAMQTHTYSLAETSAAVKRVLGTIFPGTKFSVRCESYSMGCSIDASWADGPNDDQVRPILGVFERCGFDGMQDLKTYNETLEWAGHRFEFHGDYVRGTRHTSVTMLREAAERFTRETGLASPAITDTGKYAYCERGNESCGWSFCTHQSDEYPDGWLSKDDCRYNDAGQVVQQIAGHTSKESPAIPFVTTWADGEGEPENSVRSVVFRILLGKSPVSGSGADFASRQQLPERCAISGAELTENEDKDGYEIRFPTKPDASTLEQLKAGGWRWSRFGACWYHKRTPAALSLAQQFTTEAATA